MLRKMFYCLVVWILAVSAASAKNYYIDFDSGSDLNDGLTPATAFQHCPGDVAAVGNAKTTYLMPGDIAIFKGGVKYRSSIQAYRSGYADQPVTYDGNTAGTFGQGRAIIDGSDPVANWTQCESQAACGDNPNWQNIYYALIPAPSDHLFVTNLTQGDRYMGIAQDPNPQDLFFQDVTSQYRTIVAPIPYNSGGQMEYIDATYFTQPEADYYGDDAYFAIWAGSNRIYWQKFYDYDPATHTVHFEYLSASQYDAGRGKFCMFNAITLIDMPGEYYVKLSPETGGQHKIYTWPYDGDTSDLRISRRNYGFKLLSSQHVVIQGFLIEKQSNGYENAGIVGESGNFNNITIRDNEIRLVRNLNEVGRRSGAITLGSATNCLIDNNVINENIGCIGFLLSGYNDSVTSNNYLRKCGSTAVDYYGCHHSTLISNTLVDNKAVHANGLTLYLGCSNILVEGNHVTGGNVSLTAQQGSNFIIRNNFFRYGGTSGNDIAFWTTSNLTNIEVYNNTLGGRIYGQNGTGSEITIRNNILSTLHGTLQGPRSHNLYTNSSSYANSETGGIYEPSLTNIYVNPSGGDYHLAPNSVAINKATATLAPETDFDGKRRPIGGAYDIGAYEYGEEDALIVGRYVFYNNSAFDNNDPAASADDDNAVATDKQSLLPGQSTGFANYTSYHKGINGVMIDLADMPETANPTAADFEFHAYNSSLPEGWPAAPAPASVTLRRGAGVDGSDRITITWPDYAITRKWLKVTIKATESTGLSVPDVFYFGNAVGDTGDQTDNAIVDATDQVAARNNPAHFLKPAAVDNIYDHNRDGKVDASDEIISRNSPTTYTTALRMFTAPQ